MKQDKEFFRKIGQIGLKKRWEKEHAKVRINPFWSKEKAAISAYLCGDGYIAVREDINGNVHNEIKIILDNLKLCDFIIKLFRKEFRISPKVRIRKDNCFSVDIENKPACAHLLSLGKYKSAEWMIPRGLNKNQLKEWIKCFFDCEAYIDLKRKVIRVKSINGLGLKSVLDALRTFKIESRLYGPYNQKMPHHSPYFMLFLSKKYLLVYKRLINFHHPLKREKLAHVA